MNRRILVISFGIIAVFFLMSVSIAECSITISGSQQITETITVSPGDKINIEVKSSGPQLIVLLGYGIPAEINEENAIFYSDGLIQLKNDFFVGGFKGDNIGISIIIQSASGDSVSVDYSFKVESNNWMIFGVVGIIIGCISPATLILGSKKRANR